MPKTNTTSEDKRSTIFDGVKREISSGWDEGPDDDLIASVKKPLGSLGLQNVHHEKDPRETILDIVGKDTLDKFRLSGAQVLVATYIRPDKLRSGLIITSKVRDEDKFQGKCGLVLKMGPLAFVDRDPIGAVLDGYKKARERGAPLFAACVAGFVQGWYAGKIQFGGYKASVGDWTWYRPMDGFAVSLAGASDAVHCRVLDDVEVRGDLEHPDVIL